jgi:hypothetical protein
MFHLHVLKVDLGVAHVVNSYACMFQSYASSVSSRCCKSRSGCCICCNDKIRLLEAYVLSVS